MTRWPWRGPLNRRARHLANWGIGLALALAAVGCGVGGDQPMSVLRPAGPVAEAQDDLWDLVFWIAAVIFVLVNAALIVALVRFRARGDETAPPRQVHGNTKLEVIWTIIPAAILAAIAIPTVTTIFALQQPPAPDALEIQVVGKQYWWEFEYLNAGVPNSEGENVVTASELHIPVDREVFIYLNGRDDNSDDNTSAVLHSFWVPRLAGKQDYVPGNVKTMRIEAVEPGQRYLGECAEFCGLSHANMRFVVVTHTAEEFDDWLAHQAEPAATSEQVAEGRELFATAQCVACHVVEGHPENQGIRVGPNLTHFALREKFAGYIIENTPENLHAWISDPQQIKPGAQMPAFNSLSDAEIDALVAYLQSLD